MYDLEKRFVAFACLAIEVVDSLIHTRSGNHVAAQLVRSGTSPAANYAEAQSAESRKDFIHKLKIVLKELRETRVWLLVIRRRTLSEGTDCVAKAIRECQELIAIIQASVTTAEANARKPRK